MTPEPPKAADPAHFAALLLDPTLPCPADLVAWNGSEAAARLAVYRNNVRVSCVDALADSFAVVQELVGEAFFRAMAARFVQQQPPRSPILAHYGGGFAAFIAAFEPARSVPYLADVAALEFARVQAFHAADADAVEEASVNLALASGERIGELRVQLHPSVRVLRSRFAVVSIWAAHQGAGDLAAVEVGRAEDALVLRDGLQVLVSSLPPGAAAFVIALREGGALGDAAHRAVEQAAGFDLPGCLALLMRHAAISSLHLPPALQ